MPEVGWTRRNLCFICLKRGVVRIFSGIGAGGFAACADHRTNAENEALEPLSDPNVSNNWTVKAYEIDTTDDGYPRPGRLLWSAKKRLAKI